MANRSVADITNEADFPVSPFAGCRIVSARYYVQHGGQVKPHVDVARDGVSTHTIIFYLNDCDGDIVFADGTRFSPRQGLVIKFPKRTALHWVEAFGGERRLIICDALDYLR